MMAMATSLKPTAASARRPATLGALLLLVLAPPAAVTAHVRLAIGGGEGVSLFDWRLSGEDAKLSVAVAGQPSLVHLDLVQAGKLNEPFDGTNIDDASQRWVMRESNWTYSAKFSMRARPAQTPFTSRPVWRALLTPQVNHESCYRCG